MKYASFRDKSSKREKIATKTHPNKVEKIQNQSFTENVDESDDLKGEGVKIIIPSNMIKIWTRLEIPLG